MSRRLSKVCPAPIAIASNGTFLLNAHQLALADDLDAAIEVARKSGLVVFVGLVLPAATKRRRAKIIDDAAAEIAGRVGAKLTTVDAVSASDPEGADEGQARRGRPSARRQHRRSRQGRPS